MTNKLKKTQGKTKEFFDHVVQLPYFGTPLQLLGGRGCEDLVNDLIKVTNTPILSRNPNPVVGRREKGTREKKRDQNRAKNAKFCDIAEKKL